MIDGELIRDGDDYVLRFERDLAYPIERVWRAISNPADLAAWFPSTVEVELRVGGRATFVNDPDFHVDPELLATTGEVVELDPQHRFAFTWGNDLLRFELAPTASGCRLVFTHRLPHRACVNRTVSGWSVCLDALSGALAGTQSTGPGWRAYYDRYAAVFGDAGTVSRDGDATVLRFEQLMPVSADKVWSALTGAGGYAEGGEILRELPGRVIERAPTPGEPEGIVKWQLIPVAGECLLLLTHTVNGDVDAAAALAGWDQVLAALTADLT